MRASLLAVAVILASAGAARAEVAATWDTGFQLKARAELAAPPGRAYAAVGEMNRWWSGAHTYSGQAANLRMSLAPGGCFCEEIPGGGGVVHGRVVLAWPAQGLVRLEAPLGPLQDQGVSAAWTFAVKPAGAGAASVEMTYTVSGGRPGLAQAMAGPVDTVMSEAFARYVAYLRTGKPD